MIAENPPIFLDTETCGLHGPIVLMQFAIGDGEVVLYEPWTNTIQATIDLIDSIANHPGGVVIFNAAFDWFHLAQMRTTLELMSDKEEILQYCIDEYAYCETRARDGKCLKPVKCCDLMLIARKGEYQTTMSRKPIYIRRVPVQVAQKVANYLEDHIPLREIFFARRKIKHLPKWRIVESKDHKTGKIIPGFFDIVLAFKPSSALKVLCNDIWGEDRFGRERSTFSDVEVDKKLLPNEKGWAPFALAVGEPGRWNGAWPSVIRFHIHHWADYEPARQYAADDVTDTRNLYYYFDSPALGDDDSELACMVGAVRWSGFEVDIPGLKAYRRECLQILKRIPRDVKRVRAYLFEVMSDEEKIGPISFTTKKQILENMETWEADCPKCEGTGEIDDSTESTVGLNVTIQYGDRIERSTQTVGVRIQCPSCDGGAVPHPAAERAANVLRARAAKKEIEVLDKILEAGRFHASFVVIGTLSTRMSGSDRLNPQAIKKSGLTRSFFKLARKNEILCGGDFDSFEVTLAVAKWNDDKLVNVLQSTTECYAFSKKLGETCGGKDPDCEDCHGTNKAKVKIHALFGTFCYPDMTYEQIVKHKVKYTRSKSAFFSKIYGGNEQTMMTRLGIGLEAATKANAMFESEFPQIGVASASIFDRFCSMRQPRGLGSTVIWHEPDTFVESMFGHKRFFTLENEICRALFALANRPPPEFKNTQRVMRDVVGQRMQTVSGATQSAIYGAAFQIQAANMRAAKNHEIQSSGAEITKDVQRKIWDVQPSGFTHWLVRPMNVHDEIMAPCKKRVAEKIKWIVHEAVEKYRPAVPLIGMDWKIGLKSWGEK